MPPQIHFSPDQIPLVKEPLPLLKLGAPALPSTDMLTKLVRTVAPNAAFKELKNGARGAYQGERLVAFVNPKTGESKVFPSLEALKPSKGLADRAKAVAAKLAGDRTLFPEDGTRAVPLAPTTLKGQQHSRDGKSAAAGEYLGYVTIQRRVGSLPVFGPGTQAVLAVAADDSIHGLSHRWRHAAASDERVAPHSVTEIEKAILAQLRPSATSSDVKVDRVLAGYYDGGGQYLQPVYRFEATILQAPLKGVKKAPANRHVAGYVSIGAAAEPLPVLGKAEGKPPAEPPAQKGAAAAPPPGDPTVARYVVRNDSVEWVNSANAFWSNLALADAFGSPIPFTNSQYYWAEPRLFTTQKESFIDSVHVCLTEVHGNWGLFSTRDNHDDIVRLTDIPASGYGPGAGGHLAYWFIHSCEVIPTATDETTSFDIWWRVFNGMHAALGYRTEMWIADHVMGPVGFMIGLGAPVVSSWLNEIAGNSSYHPDATYLDGNRHITEPMGRASAVCVCGHSDDIVSQVSNLGRPSCLTEWWFDN